MMLARAARILAVLDTYHFGKLPLPRPRHDQTLPAIVENALNPSDIERLAVAMRERKRLLREEIREGLARSGDVSHADLLSGTADAGDESIANLLIDVAHAEIARDAGELRDILAAQERIAQGVYGICIDCGAWIDHARLQAYPTAKRCLSCQAIHERTRGVTPPRL